MLYGVTSLFEISLPVTNFTVLNRVKRRLSCGYRLCGLLF